jgi:hypothetical protein
MLVIDGIHTLEILKYKKVSSVTINQIDFTVIYRMPHNTRYAFCSCYMFHLQKWSMLSAKNKVSLKQFENGKYVLWPHWIRN